MAKKLPAAENSLTKMRNVWFSPPPPTAQKDDAPLQPEVTKSDLAPLPQTPEMPLEIEGLEESTTSPKSSRKIDSEGKSDNRKGFEKTNRRTIYYLAPDQPLRLKCIAIMKRKKLNYFIQDVLEEYLSRPENEKLYRDFRRIYPDEFEVLKNKS